MVSHHPAKVCDHKHCGSGDIKVLVCYVITQNHVIIWSFDLDRRYSRYATILPNFVAIDIVVVDI